MTDFWVCKGCGSVISGNFTAGFTDKDNPEEHLYSVECPVCGHSGLKADNEITTNYQKALEWAEAVVL